MKEISINPSPEDWPRLTERPAINAVDLENAVIEILAATKLNGDAAVQDFSQKFQGFAPDQLWVTPEEIGFAVREIDENLKQAIMLASHNIEKFHSAQLEETKMIETSPEVICWRRSVPIQRVGLYIPGGSAPLFSTLLMLAIPAKIAGCENIVVSTPSDEKGRIHPAILFVAHLLGLNQIYKAGGAQAIAAMAYGTKTLQKVDKIFGPGNQYVTCAKKLVSMEGTAIDMLAGPSELAVYADETCMPAYVAADLLSQAEHGADSQVVLVASAEWIIRKVQTAISEQADLLPRKEIIEKSLLNAMFVVIPEPQIAFQFLNYYAPEHLIIASDKAESLAHQVKNAGSVFLGNYSPEAAGDYASGTNHSLPTNGAARAFSGVSADSFVKKITFQKISPDGLLQIGPAIEIMAAAEGLDAHKLAVSHRLKNIF